MTKIQIRAILNVYAVCIPALATWPSVTVARRITTVGGRKARFSLSNVTVDIEPMSRNFHDRVKPIIHSTKLIAGILPIFLH